MSSVIERDALAELRAIAERGATAADRGGSAAELRETYEGLRERAEVLAARYGWATTTQLADQLPSPKALAQVERLDVAFGPESNPASAPDRSMATRLRDALNDLAGWATGVRLAYETLEDSGPRT
jgi:hypothetical protein